jgi:hypothetical protein
VSAILRVIDKRSGGDYPRLLVRCGHCQRVYVTCAWPRAVARLHYCIVCSPKYLRGARRRCRRLSESPPPP